MGGLLQNRHDKKVSFEDRADVQEARAVWDRMSVKSQTYYLNKLGYYDEPDLPLETGLMFFDELTVPETRKIIKWLGIKRRA